MNANELANEIMEHYKAELPRGFNVNWMKDAATMLRQQQTEIETLKQSKFDGNNKVKELTDEEIVEILKEFDDKDADDWFIAIARAILRKAQEK